MAHHVFPYLVGILLSAFWSTVLGVIEVFDSDMDIALLYFIFAGLSSVIRLRNLCPTFLLVFQLYLWVCAASLYRDLLEIEQNPAKPTRTQV